MRYGSTRGLPAERSFEDVLLEGLAPDGGLYVPEHWPALPEISPDDPYERVVEAVVAPYVEGCPLEEDIASVCAEAYSGFRRPEVAPVLEVAEDLWLLELFWGPTLSFKDYALQLVGRLFDRALTRLGRRMLVLGATSGDTGSAAIAAVAGRPAIDAVILYPRNRVSEVQRRQMTTVPDANVHAVAVDGTFDDCQDLVKGAFGDSDLRRRLSLGAINSINWARVMAQTAYYVWAWRRVGKERLSFTVPTGNFGNAFAGYVAGRMGLPVTRLVLGNNANHGLTDLVHTGRLPIGPVVATVAPAMDIQVPSNLERYLWDLFGGDGMRVAELVVESRHRGAIVLDEVRHGRMRDTFEASWSDDAAIEATIASVYDRRRVLLDPHTAAGWAAASSHRSDGEPMVLVATAHPAKFPEVVAAATGEDPELPADLADLLERPERTEEIPNDPGALAALLGRVGGGRT